MMAGSTRQRKTQAGGKCCVEGISSWEMCDEMHGYGSMGAGWILVSNWSTISSVETLNLALAGKACSFQRSVCPL